MNMLTQTQFDKWIEALESGKYKQGRNRLCRKSFFKKRFCCLGVLADTIDSSAWTKGDKNTFKWDSNSAILPNYIIPANAKWTLIEKNDQERASFKEIAQFLKENKQDYVE